MIMDTKDIQTRIDAVNSIVSAKGLRECVVCFKVEGHKETSVYAHWYAGARGHDFKSWSSRPGSAEAALDQAEAWSDALPSIDERKMSEFMSALGGVIDLGRENGIDVAFVNPLTETMKALSKNALTYQRHAAE